MLPLCVNLGRHFYIVMHWPGHEIFVPTGTYSSLGELADNAEHFWPAVRAAPSVEAARAILLDVAPKEYFHSGEAILRNKAAQLAAQRVESNEPVWTLDDFVIPPLPIRTLHPKLVANPFLPFTIVLCGSAGIGKSCFAAAHG